ncbi:MAG: hypothetical protein MUC56_08645 [Thermoanaerobaculales bacterium]|jgi:hypothetical protein|nr:hypothetical protein [Thermoanaerobaculales bacterium]
MVAAETHGGSTGKAPVHFWIVSVLSLLWNSIGAFDYLASQLRLEFYMSQFDEKMLAFLDAMPAWAVSGWAIAVWGAMAGSVGLLLRRRWAVWAFAVSIVGMVVSTLHSYVLSNGLELMGTGGLVFSAIIWAIAFALFFYARAMAGNGVLR